MSSTLKWQDIPPLFRTPFLAKISRGKHTQVLRRLADQVEDLSPPDRHESLATWYDFYYEILLDHYRSEYVYKNEIANQVYLKHHSLQDSLLISEMGCSQSKSDLALIDDRTSTVFEIKSEFDSFKRLKKQLTDYRKVFDRIYVVTTKEQASHLKVLVDPVIGIMYLNGDRQFETLQPALSNKAHTNPSDIFNCMHQAEFCEAINREFGYVPDAPSALLYRECIQLFTQLPPDRAHDLMIDCVRSRGKKQGYVELIEAAPRSLKHVCLGFNHPQYMARQIADAFKKPVI